MTAAPGRYAVYFAPAVQSPWWRFGASWLGRDEALDSPRSQPLPLGWQAEHFHVLTREPRRYGLHATLKAPFRPTVPHDALCARLDALAGELQTVPLAPLVPVYMDGFLALVPAVRNPALNALAAQCVTQLDDLRQPLTGEERARRQPEQLDVRGRELLDHYGYPHVLERFRFHITLTGPCDMATAGGLVSQLAPALAALNQASPPVLDRLCLFHEPAPGANFVRVHDVQVQA